MGESTDSHLKIATEVLEGTNKAPQPFHAETTGADPFDIVVTNLTLIQSIHMF